MDPQRAYDVLSLAATRSVPLSTGRVCFSEFKEIHAAEVRACKSRTDSLGLAKKYLKACEALEDFEKGLENSPNPARMYRAPQLYDNKGVSKTPDPSSGAIVPFAKTTPIEHPISFTPESQPVALRSHNVCERALITLTACSKSRVAQHYYSVLNIAFQIAVCLPLLMLICFCAYFTLTALYLVFHSAVLARLVLQMAKDVVSLGIEHVALQSNSEGLNVSETWIPTWF